MADEVVAQPVTTNAPVQPVANPAPSPTSETAQSTPAVVAAPYESTILGAAPPVTKEVEAKPETKEVEVKPAIQEPVEGAKETQPVAEPKADGTQSEEPAPLPTYEPYVLPEGIVPDADGFSHLNKMLGEFELQTKADHAEVHKLGQTLVDRHVEQLNKTIQKVSDAWRQEWENKTNGWLESFKSDPEIGGNRQETTVNAALQFIRTHGGTDEQQAELRNLFDETKVGNHPALIRLLAKANSAMSEGRPLPAKAPALKQSKTDKFYGGNTR